LKAGKNFWLLASAFGFDENFLHRSSDRCGGYYWQELGGEVIQLFSLLNKANSQHSKLTIEILFTAA
jgi:hypothetical protein